MIAMLAEADIAASMSEVLDEVRNNRHRPLPRDPLRCAALVAEEAGEALKAALDLTRDQPAINGASEIQTVALYRELTQTAAMALRVMVHMRGEIEDIHTLQGVREGGIK